MNDETNPVLMGHVLFDDINRRGLSSINLVAFLILLDA
jgi:hypothetical protein